MSLEAQICVKGKSIMTRPQTKSAKTSPVRKAVSEIIFLVALMQRCQRSNFEHKVASTAEARKIANKAASLVATVAKLAPDSKAHGDALFHYSFVVAILANMSKRKAVSKALKQQADELLIASANIKLQQPDCDAVHAALCVALNLIAIDKRPQEGLKWLQKAKSAFEAIDKAKVSQQRLYFDGLDQAYWLARAHYDLGHSDKARRILKSALRQTPPPLNKAAVRDLNGMARCIDLLGKIHWPIEEAKWEKDWQKYDEEQADKIANK
jgi:tetratricopeptide (TPR) repeat protein